MAKNYNDLFMLDFTEMVEEVASELRFFLHEPEKLDTNTEYEFASNME